MSQILVQFSDTPLSSWTKKIAIVIWKLKSNGITESYIHSHNKHVSNAYYVLCTVLGYEDTSFIKINKATALKGSVYR